MHNGNCTRRALHMKKTIYKENYIWRELYIKEIKYEEECTQKDYRQRRLYMKRTAEYMLETHSTKWGLYSREVKE